MRIDEYTALTQDGQLPADQDLNRLAMAVTMVIRAAQTTTSLSKFATFDLPLVYAFHATLL